MNIQYKLLCTCIYNNEYTDYIYIILKKIILYLIINQCSKGFYANTKLNINKINKIFLIDKFQKPRLAIFPIKERI